MRWIAPLAFCGRSLLYDSFLGRARAFSPSRLSFASHRLWTTPSTAALLSSVALSTSSSPGDFQDHTDSTMTAAFSGTGYLNAADAAALDEELMSTPGFSLEQLMELAGLAVAEAVYESVPPPEEEAPAVASMKKVVFVCGPGNNGGDGLVAARHLSFFGNYDCTIVYPKRSAKKQHFVNLVKQCEDVGIPVLDELPPQDELGECDAIVDAIFGFSFKGEPREPFGTILRRLKEVQEAENKARVLSVDVPSGWNVDEGDVADTGFVPDALISLTAPKLCSKEFKGEHFIGGRFLPPGIANKYNVRMPPYPGVSQVMEVTREHIEGESTPAKTNPEKGSTSSSTAADQDSWRAEYAAYLVEKEQEANDKADTTASPPPAADNDGRKEPDDEDSWQAQYAAHCAEKEVRLAEEDAKQRETHRKALN